MNFMHQTLSVFAAGFLFAVAVADGPVQWTEAEGGNGHWYEAVYSGPGTSWNWSREAAIARGGYIATIQTAEEDNMVIDRLLQDESLWGGQYGPHIGGWQDTNAKDYSEPNGGWYWITGEQMSYQNWETLDNCCGGQQNIMYGRRGGGNSIVEWNDVSDVDTNPSFRSYLIEWSADCNDDGIVDYGQILDGTLVDTDQNGVPDWCDSCTSDVNGDGTVDAADLGALLALWGTNANSSPRADANRDGTVDAADLGLLLGYWGDCP